MDSVFNPFFTTKEVGKGTGMGLAMVHGILHSQNAHILLDVTPDVGSNFRLFFPVTEADLPLPEEPQGSSDLQQNLGLNVLLVDDEEAIIELMEEVLVIAGCKVTCLTSSKEALKLINNQLDQFDLLITDQTMPEVDGAALSKAALHINPAFPILICTGFSTHMNRVVAKELGIRQLLEKPIIPQVLIDTVQEIFADQQ